MIVEDVMNDLADALRTIDNLRVYAYPTDSVQPPSAVLTLPERVEFDETYMRGSDRIQIHVVVILDKAYDRTVVPRMSGFASGSGESAVKAVLEGYDSYTAFDWLHVKACEFEPYEYQGQNFMAAIFEVEIVGVGDAEANPRPLTAGGPPVVVTDLSFGVHTDTTIELLSSTGDDVVLPAATSTLAGLMTAADRVIMDNGGPVGPAGPEGPQGPAGVDGVDGADGNNIPRLSALPDPPSPDDTIAILQGHPSLPDGLYWTNGTTWIQT